MKRPILAALVLAAAAAVPATASAASIELATNDDGTSVIAYKARSGEVNALKMFGTVGGGFDLRMAFFEHRARLTAGRGCESGFPVICGAVDAAFPVEVSLGDRSDVANVNSFTEVLSLDAGSGDDDVLAGGFDATAEGGSGNDTIRLAANNGTRGNAGSGRDRITGGLGAVAAILDGGSGADLVVPDGSIFNDARGGTGDDQLVAPRGRDIRLDGGDGDDLLVALTGRGPILLDGGDDDDLAFSHAGNVTANTGSGHDVVEVQGGPDTAPDSVSCGSGWDIAWVDEADTVASDCELKFRSAAPTFRRVASAEAAAQALLEHDPDPTKR
jgi:Ca2+-binding RTX toxin-like protein